MFIFWLLTVFFGIGYYCHPSAYTKMVPALAMTGSAKYLSLITMMVSSSIGDFLLYDDNFVEESILMFSLSHISLITKMNPYDLIVSYNHDLVYVIPVFLVLIGISVFTGLLASGALRYIVMIYSAI